MATKLPTVYHGIPKQDADTALVEDANQTILAKLNSIPPHLIARVVASVVVSVCCAQEDPVMAFETISYNAATAISAVIAKTEGSA